jgi:hypothetical protein
MCRITSLFLLQRLKGSMSGDACDCNKIETRAVIQFFSLCKARRRMKFSQGSHFSSDTGVIAAAEIWLDGQHSVFEWLAKVRATG